MAETAGLVLGILPLVIEGLKLYVKSIETAKRYWKYAGVVSSLVETLDVERAIYNNNCVILLQDIVTENELALLLENPGGSFWKDEMLERKLTETLGKSYRPFVQVLTSMSNLMESFKREIGMEGGEVCYKVSFFHIKQILNANRSSGLTERNLNTSGRGW